MKGEKLYEIKKYLFVTVKSILCLLDELYLTCVKNMPNVSPI